MLECHFTPKQKVFVDFPTSVDSDFHLVPAKIHPGHDTSHRILPAALLSSFSKRDIDEYKGPSKDTSEFLWVLFTL